MTWIIYDKDSQKTKFCVCTKVISSYTPTIKLMKNMTTGLTFSSQQWQEVKKKKKKKKNSDHKGAVAVGVFHTTVS